jgi:hypothetical protein
MTDVTAGNVIPIEPRIRLVAVDDIQVGTQRRYLVKGLIPRIGLTIVRSKSPKSGKSFWTFDLMMHVALGWQYRGRRVHQGSIVYCAFEGQMGIETRCAAFAQRFLAEDREPVPFFVELVTLDLVQDVASAMPLLAMSIVGTASPSASWQHIIRLPPSSTTANAFPIFRPIQGPLSVGDDGCRALAEARFFLGFESDWSHNERF